MQLKNFKKDFRRFTKITIYHKFTFHHADVTGPDVVKRLRGASFDQYMTPEVEDPTLVIAAHQQRSHCLFRCVCQQLVVSYIDSVVSS